MSILLNALLGIPTGGWVAILVITCLIIIIGTALIVILTSRKYAKDAATAEARRIEVETRDNRYVVDYATAVVKSRDEYMARPIIEEPIAEPVEDTATEDVPVTEEPETVEDTESVVADEPVEETAEEVIPEVAEIVEEAANTDIPAVIVADAIEDDEEEYEEEEEEEVEYITEGKEKITYDRSFTARIIQLRDEPTNWYNQIKNALLSYNKVKSRISWKHETFRVGRKTIAVMTVRGKTLRLNLALDPAKFADTKYAIEDMSHISASADTPALYRIRGPRRAKYAIELIDILMAEQGVEKLANYEAQDYYMPYEGTMGLIERGLIKRVVTSTTRTFEIREVDNNTVITEVTEGNDKPATTEEVAETVAEVTTDDTASDNAETAAEEIVETAESTESADMSAQDETQTTEIIEETAADAVADEPVEEVNDMATTKAKTAEPKAKATEPKVTKNKSADKDGNCKMILLDETKQSFGKFMIIKSADANNPRPFTFQLLANNGQILFESEPYKAKPNKRTFEAFKKYASVRSNFSIDEDKKGTYRYKLYNPANSALVGVGESYPSKQACESSIESVVRFSISATVIYDTTVAED